MRRRLITILFVCALSASSFGQLPEQYVYRVQCIDGGKTHVLSGFREKTNTGIVTALHGVLSGTLSANNITHQYLNLTLKGVDIDNDATLLSSADLEREPADGVDFQQSSSLQKGEIVYVTGYPFDIQKRTDFVTIGIPPLENASDIFRGAQGGWLASRNSPSTESVLINISMIYPGYSGAPVWDATGKVVGIANGGFPSTNICWAIPWEKVHFTSPEQNAERLHQLKTLVLPETYHFSYQPDFDSESLHEALNSALNSANAVKDLVTKNQQVFRESVFMPWQLVKLYFKQLDDLKQHPNDVTVLSAVNNTTVQLAPLSLKLPFAFEYVSALQTLIQRLESVAQKPGLSSGDSQLLSSQIDQIQMIQKNVTIVASIVTNPDPKAVENKATPFGETFVSLDGYVLGANLNLINQLAAKQ